MYSVPVVFVEGTS